MRVKEPKQLKVTDIINIIILLKDEFSPVGELICPIENLSVLKIRLVRKDSKPTIDYVFGELEGVNEDYLFEEIRSHFWKQFRTGE